MQNDMDYSLIQRTPDGTGKILVTTPGIPNKGSYVLEADLKIYTNQGMVAIADIVDDLVTADATKPLSANQGVVLKQLIDAVSGGITPKGDILSSNLPAADASNKGWQYYCTDLNKYATSDGTQWVYTSNSPIVQTPDATDTGHALSNAVVTQKCNAVEATLNQHDARIQNLEQKAGDYSIVQYRGTDAVPTGKAKYGLVKNIVGKTRAWNQMFDNSKFRVFSGSATMSGGVITFTGNATVDETNRFKTTGGHKYLFLYTSKNDITGTTRLVNYHEANASRVHTIPISSNYQQNGFIFESIGTTETINFLCSSYTSGTMEIKTDIILRDLTLIFGSGNEPSTVADALAQLPSLGQYNAYDAGSLVSTTVEGVESVGVNIWDEEWEEGDYNISTGVKHSASNRLRNKNFIRVMPNTTYSFGLFGTYQAWIRILYYDANKNYLGTEQTTSFTTADNVQYINFNTSTGYGPVYKHDIQICLNSYADKTTYHPYKTDSLTLPETVTLRSAGSVADELDVESGVIVRKVELFTMSGSESLILRKTENNLHYYRINSVLTKNAKADLVGKLVSDKFIKGDAYSGQTPFICNLDINTIYFTVPSSFSSEDVATYITGANIVYELATPTTESVSPTLDNTIYTEGGGTIDTVQTQTPVIDNCLDVGYLTL